MWNNPGINNMPMQNMPNQFMNLNQNNLQELIKPYKDKIKKLEKELEEKSEEITQLKLQLLQYNNSNKQQFMNNNMDNMNNIMNQMCMMNINMNQMNMMNNNMNRMGMMNDNMNQMGNMNNNMNQMGTMSNNMNQMNMMNNNMNQMGNMNNNMNQMNNNIISNPMFQMCNQMNINDNMMMPVMPMGNTFQEEIKYLTIKVKMENNQSIQIQCKSDDKMETLINKFCCKVNSEKEEYEFLINGITKVKSDLTIKDNGINGNNYFILAKKIISNYINSRPFHREIIPRKEETLFLTNELNNKNQNKKNVCFVLNRGQRIVFPIEENKTIRDVLIEFCEKLNIPIPSINELLFLYNATKLDPDGKITLKQLSNSPSINITVLEQNNIIAA